MNERIGTHGLILNEPLLWEKGVDGRTAFSCPEPDVDSAPLADELAGNGPNFPDLSEVDVVRHYLRLSQWNFSVDTGMYPLGSCTMKYNPKTNERQAAIAGFCGAHPLLPAELSQGALALLYRLERYLANITGLPCVTVQPAAGSHGELTGMLVFAAFHTAQGKPGETYMYNGFLFGFLSLVAEEASGKPYSTLLVDHIIAPLEMTNTIPNITEEHRDQILAKRAKYYRTGFGGEFKSSSYPVTLSSSAGIVTTVLDMTKFDIAMDRNLIVSAESKATMFSRTISNSGKPLPYGLGWFVQEHAGVKLVWHYGWAPKAYSSLILKVPEKNVTFILFANSEGASADFHPGRGDMLRSPFAVSFLNVFTDLQLTQKRF